MHCLIPNAQVPLATIVKEVDGDLIGPSDTYVRGLCPLTSPIAGAIAFSRSGNVSEIVDALKGVQVGAVLIPAPAPSDLPKNMPPLIVVKDPQGSMERIQKFFFRPLQFSTGVHPSAVVHPSAQLGSGVSIGPLCVVGADVVIEDRVTLISHVSIYEGARIGAQTTLHAGVTVREGCVLGRDCILHSGVVIGSDGFGYSPDPLGKGLNKIPQLGIVRLGDQVEVGANSCIDRATFGETHIGNGSKIDNLVQIGHNVRVGMYSIICAMVGIGGSTEIGNQVVVAAQAGIRDHVRVHDGVRIAASAGVTNHVEGGDVAGFPAVPVADWRRQSAALARLPQFMKKLRGFVRKD